MTDEIKLYYFSVANFSFAQEAAENGLIRSFGINLHT